MRPKRQTVPIISARWQFYIGIAVGLLLLAQAILWAIGVLR